MEYKGDATTYPKDMNKLRDVIFKEMEFLRSISNLPLKIVHLISWRATFGAVNGGEIKVNRSVPAAANYLKIIRDHFFF